MLSVTRKRHLFQECSVSRNQERIQDFCHSGGSEGDSPALPPPPPNEPKFSHFFLKIGQSYVGAPFWRVGAPSYGESGIHPCLRRGLRHSPSSSPTQWKLKKNLVPSEGMGRSPGSTNFPVILLSSLASNLAAQWATFFVRGTGFS